MGLGSAALAPSFLGTQPPYTCVTQVLMKCLAHVVICDVLGSLENVDRVMVDGRWKNADYKMWME